MRFTVLLTTKNSGLLKSMEDGAVSPEESPGVPRIFSRKDPIKSFRKKKKKCATTYKGLSQGLSFSATTVVNSCLSRILDNVAQR